MYFFDKMTPREREREREWRASVFVCLCRQTKPDSLLDQNTSWTSTWAWRNDPAKCRPIPHLATLNPPVMRIFQFNHTHVLSFHDYLNQFRKNKVHHQACAFFGQPDPPSPCTCPLKQAWESLDTLFRRRRATYEEHGGGSSDSNPFGNGSIRIHLREEKEKEENQNWHRRCQERLFKFSSGL